MTGSTTTQTRVLRLRLKDKHAAALRAMSRDVNLVWNYCNELSAKVFERERRFVGAYEMHKYLAGASKEGLAVGSAVFQEVADEYVRRRKQFKRNRGLAWLEKEISTPGEARADEAGVSKGALRAPVAGHGHPAVGIPVLSA